MDTAVILAYFSALWAGAVVLATAFQERRSKAHWLFVAGMTCLAVESILSGLTADAVLPDGQRITFQFSISIQGEKKHAVKRGEATFEMQRKEK